MFGIIQYLPIMFQLKVTILRSFWMKRVGLDLFFWFISIMHLNELQRTNNRAYLLLPVPSFHSVVSHFPAWCIILISFLFSCHFEITISRPVRRWPTDLFRLSIYISVQLDTLNVKKEMHITAIYDAARWQVSMT